MNWIFKILFIISVFSLFILIFFSGEDDKTSVFDKQVEIESATFFGITKNKKSYEVRAKRFLQDGKKERFLMFDINGVFYDEEGKVKIKADKAYYNKKIRACL